jgi:hypothetical protein
MLKHVFTLILFSSLSITQLTYAEEKSIEITGGSLSKALLDTPLIEVGNAKFSVLFWDIYHSKLLTPTGRYFDVKDPNSQVAYQPLLFKIKYLRDITQKDLIEKTIEQWKHLAINEKKYLHYITLLQTMWPNIKTGDSLALLITENKSDFYFNDNFIGSISGEDFGKLFLAIWLSPNTSKPKLRKQLLGQ